VVCVLATLVCDFFFFKGRRCGFLVVLLSVGGLNSLVLCVWPKFTVCGQLLFVGLVFGVDEACHMLKLFGRYIKLRVMLTGVPLLLQKPKKGNFKMKITPLNKMKIAHFILLRS
jgi:hypothetical protein